MPHFDGSTILEYIPTILAIRPNSNRGVPVVPVLKNPGTILFVSSWSVLQKVVDSWIGLRICWGVGYFYSRQGALEQRDNVR